MKRWLSPLLPLMLLAGEAPPLVIHEWGTFTSVQHLDGRSLGGINTDDEPVPDFVHRLSHSVLQPRSEAPASVFAKGIPICHPDVTMRLETPVLYFHPPEGWIPQPVDLTVRFPRGWLTEFYPNAHALAPGFDAANPKREFPLTREGAPAKIGRLTPEAVGELRWQGLQLNIGGGVQFPETQDQVWLTPRKVNCASVTAQTGETEQYLFYRGVGNLPGPVTVKSAPHPARLEDPPRYYYQVETKLTTPPPAWIVQSQGEDQLNFQRLENWENTGHGFQREFNVFASPPPHTPAATTNLKAEMQAALVQAGLFPDEATAMLETWDHAYFRTPGLRLFYLLPPRETERLLPLKVSVPAQVTRVMVGRVEIITPEQEGLIQKIAAGPAPDMTQLHREMGQLMSSPEGQQRYIEVFRGTRPLEDLDLKLPPLYADYLRLGRFRNALLLDAQTRHPTPALEKFIADNVFPAVSR